MTNRFHVATVVHEVCHAAFETRCKEGRVNCDEALAQVSWSVCPGPVPDVGPVWSSWVREGGEGWRRLKVCEALAGLLGCGMWDVQRNDMDNIMMVALIVLFILFLLIHLF